MNTILDQWGSQVFLITKETLYDFGSFLSFLRGKGCEKSGFVKARLHPDDRDDVETLRNVLTVMSQQFDQKIRRGKRLYFAYNPNVQMTYKASITDDVYDYVQRECSGEERKTFVAKACRLDTYMQSSNCCTEALLSDGVSGLRRHCFEVLKHKSPLNSEVNESLRKANVGITDKPSYSVNGKCTPIVNGSAIRCEDPIYICRDFSLSSLSTILDCLDEKYDGIANPYIYCGTNHSIVPWHIEDVGLLSITYHAGGNPKVWFGIPPDYFGLADHIADGFRLDKRNSGCRATLAYHESVVADPEYFMSRGCPLVNVVQEAGDLVITFPFALHAGFNLGHNVTMSSNFADKEWIPMGLFAPRCACSFSDTQVHFNMTSILSIHRPDLLKVYNVATALDFPPSHPRAVRWESRVEEVLEEWHVFDQDACEGLTGPSRSCSGSVKNNERMIGSKVVKTMKARTLYCPKCNQSFTENKLCRLLRHISLKHETEADELKGVVTAKYKPWSPKTRYGFFCIVCNQFKRGSVTHLRNHYLKCHPNIPFEKPSKCVTAVL